IGHQKGRNTKENMVRNFGMPRPEGYRKARRLMELADRFRRPIFTFVDTPGAYPGIGAEARGQAEAIASSIESMAGLGVPAIASDRKSTRLNSSHVKSSYAVFCLKKKIKGR